MWPLFPAPLGVLGFSSLPSAPALILEVLAAQRTSPNLRLGKMRSGAGSGGAPPPPAPSAKAAVRPVRTRSGLRSSPAAPPTTWGRRRRDAPFAR